MKKISKSGLLFGLVLTASLVTLFLLAKDTVARELQTGTSLFSPQGPLNVQGRPTSAPDVYHYPSARHQPNQVPEKLEFVFMGHQGMQGMGAHYLSDVQTMLSDLEYINRRAFVDLMRRFGGEFRAYSGNRSLAMRSSVPAGAMAVAAMDNAGAVAEKNFDIGVEFLFQGLGNQRGSDCQGTIRGMLDGTCEWGTPPIIESQVFANVIGDDVNLNQLNGHYEVWDVSAARSTLINLIFSQGLFQ